MTFLKLPFHGRNTVVSKLSPAGCQFNFSFGRRLVIAGMWHVVGAAPGGRNTHILGLVAHVGFGS